MKKNLFEMSNSEKLRILEMHYKASGKTLLKEQEETTPPTPEAQTQQTTKIDWSEGGKKTWETADINKLIEFINLVIIDIILKALAPNIPRIKVIF
jgi:hypothetical protein